MKNKILFDMNGLDENKAKQFIEAAFDIGRINSDKSFDDVCEFVYVDTSPVLDRELEKKEIERIVEILKKAMEEQE